MKIGETERVQVESHQLLPLLGGDKCPHCRRRIRCPEEPDTMVIKTGLIKVDNATGEFKNKCPYCGGFILMPFRIK